MQHEHHVAVPRIALIAAGALIVFSIALAGLSRLGYVAIEMQEKSTEAIDETELFFKDRQQGGIAVLSAETGAVVAVFEPGTNGFARSVMRGLARERRANGFDAEVPFRLVRFADDRLTLIDPTTSREIELISFGPTNAAVFANLLMKEGSAL